MMGFSDFLVLVVLQFSFSSLLIEGNAPSTLVLIAILGRVRFL